MVATPRTKIITNDGQQEHLKYIQSKKLGNKNLGRMVDMLVGKIRTQNPYKEKLKATTSNLMGKKYSILHVESRKLNGQI